MQCFPSSFFSIFCRLFSSCTTRVRCCCVPFVSVCVCFFKSLTHLFVTSQLPTYARSVVLRMNSVSYFAVPFLFRLHLPVLLALRYDERNKSSFCMPNPSQSLPNRYGEMPLVVVGIAFTFHTTFTTDSTLQRGSGKCSFHVELPKAQCTVAPIRMN